MLKHEEVIKDTREKINELADLTAGTIRGTHNRIDAQGVFNVVLCCVLGYVLAELWSDKRKSGEIAENSSPRDK